MTTYRRSALLSALVRMWRGWAVILPAVLVNSVLQAALVWPDNSIDDRGLLVATALLSGVGCVVAYGLVTAVALQVPDGRVGWSRALRPLRDHGLRYLVWAVGVAVVATAGFALYTAPGLVVLALTPFVLLAALDAQGNPLMVNARTIGRRFWRWLVTVVLGGGVLLLGWLVSGFTTFFVRVPAASLIIWIAAGLVIAWFTTAWALIYRNAWAPSTGQTDVDEVPVAATPNLESAD